ncbi:MAG: hypothetical protein IIZ45_05895 [Firmicutes bacterium]|nr:hypothetical protein [Bacillota bacterium]
MPKKKIAALAALLCLALLFAACGSAPAQDSKAAQLYNAAVTYTDTNERTTHILDLLFGDKLGLYTAERNDAAEPATLTILFEGALPDEEKTTALACVVLALDDSLGRVEWRSATATGSVVTRENAEKIIGKSPAKYAGSAKNVQKLLDLLGIK